MSETTKPRTQADALAVLARLVAEDGPAAEWTLTDGAHERLTARGLLFATGPRAQRVGLATWQRIIGAGSVTSSSTTSFERLVVTGSYEGLPVRVSTLIDAAVAGEAA